MAAHKSRMEVNPENIRTISEEDPLKLFYAAIRSPKTKKSYMNILHFIMCDTLKTSLHGTFEERVKEFVEIGRNDEKRMLMILLELSSVMAKRTKKDRFDDDYLNPSSIPTYFVPIMKLLDMSDVAVRWNRVKMTFPEHDNVGDSLGWTREEIRRMLDHAKNTRDRALILTLASSGVRCGGLLLRWGDLTPVYRVDGRLVTEEDLKDGVPGELACVAVRVYRNTREEHVTFVTPEAYGALMDYAVKWEEEFGRKPQVDDLIFRSDRNAKGMLAGGSIYNIVKRMASSAGVRKRQHGNPRRLLVPILGGFRRFFGKTVRDTGTDESMLSVLIKAEFFMGHYGLVPLDRNYYKADVLDKAKTYVKVVPNLTISESERQKHASSSRNGRVLSELKNPDDRIIQLDGISMMERFGIIEGMCEYLRNGVFADSA